MNTYLFHSLQCLTCTLSACVLTYLTVDIIMDLIIMFVCIDLF